MFVNAGCYFVKFTDCDKRCKLSYLAEFLIVDNRYYVEISSATNKLTETMFNEFYFTDVEMRLFDFHVFYFHIGTYRENCAMKWKQQQEIPGSRNDFVENRCEKELRNN